MYTYYSGLNKGVPAGFDTVTLSLAPTSDARRFLRLNVAVTP